MVDDSKSMPPTSFATPLKIRHANGTKISAPIA